MLQAFYNGIENIFKRVTVELGQEMPRAEGWHKLLLVQMTCDTPQRPALISVTLAQTLEDYLRFRHFFRSAYSFQLRWDRMADVVRNCEHVLDLLEKELDMFLKTNADRH
jgi:hypothetical protein